MSGNPAAVSDLYETSLLPGIQDEGTTIKDFCAAHLRMSGNGGVNFTMYSLDHALAVVPAASPVSLSMSPGMEYLIRYALRNEAMSISFGCGVIGSYCIMSLIRCYYVNTLPQR
jgi:hypothetical protein